LRGSRTPAFAFALLAAGSLAACFTARGTQQPPPPPRAVSEAELRFPASTVDTTLPDCDAIAYEIDLRVSDVPKHETFAADVKGSYVATRELAELVLDFEGNTIDETLIGGRPAPHRREKKKLIVTLPRPIAAGQPFTSRIRYHGNVTQADGVDANDFAKFGGLHVRQRNAERRRIYSSLSWPQKARLWLPLRDHPADGAMVAMNLTFPRSFTVVSNGKQVARKENADGTSTWSYEALAPMPAYDFHIAAYEGWTVDTSSSASGIPIATYTYAGGEHAQAAIYGDLPKAVDFYERSFGKYRWGTARFVEEPIFGGAMEHTTVVSMDETLFRDPAQGRETAFHELAHHWSGNLVRIRTWNDFWLSEGFAEYLTARFLAANDGPEAKKRALRGYLALTLAADASAPHAVRPADPELDVLTIFDAISYQKGALVLHALERVVGGEATLTSFLKTWFDRHAFGAVGTADLEKELTAATGHDLSRFFAGFVHGIYHPEVRVTFASVGPAPGEVELRVDQLQTTGPEGGFVFPLDVDLVDATGHAERFAVDVTGKTTTKRVRTARPPVSVIVDADEWLLGTVACAAAGGGAGAAGAASVAECKSGFRCQNGAVSVCVPR
jgi:aminopeptidase N